MKRTRRLLTIAAMTSAMVVSACGGPAATPTPSPTPIPTATPIAGIAVPLDVTGGQLLITSVTYTPTGFAPLAAPDSWFEVIGKVVSGTPDLNQLGKSAGLTGDGTACMYAANGTDKPFWVFQVKTTMHAFVFTLDGHPIPLDSLLPAK